MAFGARFILRLIGASIGTMLTHKNSFATLQVVAKSSSSFGIPINAATTSTTNTRIGQNVGVHPISLSCSLQLYRIAQTNMYKIQQQRQQQQQHR
jgi:hypothetical protein